MTAVPVQCAANYVSSMCSKYHPWFMEWGYPRLDIVKYGDGEWSIIEYETMPIIPSMTKWKVILSGFRHVEITPHFVKRQVEKHDLQRREVWEREEAKARAVEEEHERAERALEDRVERATKAITRNEALRERIAKNGIKEMDLRMMHRHVPKHHFRKK